MRRKWLERDYIERLRMSTNRTKGGQEASCSKEQLSEQAARNELEHLGKRKPPERD